MPESARIHIAGIEMASRARGSTPEGTSVSLGEKPDKRISNASIKNIETPITSTTECIPYVLRSVARVIVTGETTLVGIEPLAELVLAL